MYMSSIIKIREFFPTSDQIRFFVYQFFEFYLRGKTISGNTSDGFSFTTSVQFPIVRGFLGLVSAREKPISRQVVAYERFHL